jgi:hypothetical protein
VLSDFNINGVVYSVVSNPEWFRAIVDQNDKILYGVRADGEFIFGAGCPAQVKDYVE